MSTLAHFRTEFAKSRRLGEAALARIPDEQLNTVPAPGTNSAAMLARHVGGNLVSRFTGFLTTDGEKPDRDRDGEFETRAYTRAEVEAAWHRGWTTLESTLAALEEGDLARVVTIRGEAMPAQHALLRAAVHMGYHAGQLVLLARLFADDDWASLSIPRNVARP